MSYLTNDEKKMPYKMRKAQFFLGMQCSLNKGDGQELKELLNELLDDTLSEGKKRGAVEELENLLEYSDWSQVSRDSTVTYYIVKRLKELKEGVEK
jgi:hypothetical protein